MFQNTLALREFRRIREKKENPGDVGGAPSHHVVQEKCFRNTINNFPLVSGSFYRLRVHKRKIIYVPIHFRCFIYHQNRFFFSAYGTSLGLGSYLMFNLKHAWNCVLRGFLSKPHTSIVKCFGQVWGIFLPEMQRSYRRCMLSRGNLQLLFIDLD